MIIEMKQACSCMKNYANMRCLSHVRSIFHMTAEKNGQGEHLHRNIFLNYWNLNQTFFMVGTSTKDKFFHFLDVIKRRNPSLKVNENSYLTERLSLDETKKELIDVLKRSELFYQHMNNLRLPSRCAILALLSGKRVSLFNDSLIKLMEHLLAQKWNRKEPVDWEPQEAEEDDSFEAKVNQERRSTHKAAFIID